MSDSPSRSIKWGVPAFDQLTGGIPVNNLSIIETPSFRTGMPPLGFFVYEGLQRGEKCVLVSSDSVPIFLENFQAWGLDFRPYLDNEQLIFLNYKPTVSSDVSLSHDYNALFEEIVRLSNGGKVSRLALHQVDLLINMNNLFLINSCTQKLAHTCQEGVAEGMTVLGQFVMFDDDSYRALSIAFQKVVAGYFSLSPKQTGKRYAFQFRTTKLPWYQTPSQSNLVMLQEGRGFVSLEETQENGGTILPIPLKVA